MIYTFCLQVYKQTNNSNDIYKMNSSTHYQLSENEYHEGLNWFFPEDTELTYTQIDCNIKPENIGKFVGENGRVFNAITRYSGVNYIWIDNERNVIEIWGPESKLVDAKNRLLQRMFKIEMN